ncbi:ATP-grasp fold amidoligase family protein [Bariatricus sp. SGI.154]|uniref:ATP-grasp fold amidoligase family protein n=1 Tax=Bariatricus sp. SGI.154 TaxID=3420549 RepID=UPI003D052D56
MNLADKKMKIIKKLNIEKLLPSRMIIPIYYEYHMGQKLDLKNPKTFNEKLQWLKLYYKNPIMIKLVDKIEVRNHIKEVLGEEYLIPLIGIYNCFDEINFDELPNQFVIKCNHDSGSYILCKNKKDFDIQSARSKINEHMKENYFYRWREWPYKSVKPKILIEKYMSDFEKNTFDDYKFLCFNGVADNVMVCTGREEGNTKFHFFDKEWNFKRYNYTGLNEPEGYTMKKPEYMDEMFEIAETLAQDFPCVRVDLYCANNKIYFGELTFFPQAGLDSKLLKSTDRLWGDKITLKKY